MSNGTNKDPWDKWWPRILQLSGLVIVYLIVLQHITLDPYFYPILGLMLGIPFASFIEARLKKNGNGSGQ